MQILCRTTALGLLALAIASPASAAPAPARQPRAELDSLASADAEAIVHLNVRQMLKTALVKKHALDPLKVLLQNNNELQQILNAAALDPLKDIDTINLSTSGNPLEGGKLVAVVRGDFAPDKARAAAEDYAKKHPQKLKILKDGQTTMWEIPSDRNSFYASFVGNKALVMTARKEDTAAAVARAGKSAQQPSTSMRSALDHLKGSETLWLAMVATDEIKQLMKKDDGVKEFAAALHSITASLELDADARLAVVVHTENPKAAEKIEGKLKEFLPLLGILGAGNDPNGKAVKEILGNIKVKAENKDVSIRLQITEEQIEKAGNKNR
jgi:hypothetical protein